jgi:pimeloyl-ACP methyl ester carboxylesterase
MGASASDPSVSASASRGSDPVLLLHGQPGGARDWDRVCEALGDRAHPLAIDRPGWGPGSEPADLAGNAAAALRALDSVDGGGGRATVVGFSFGGAVAAWLAASEPARVSRLVLVAPAANTAALVPLDYWLARPWAAEVVGGAMLAGLAVALSAGPLRGRVARRFALEERYLEAMARGLRNPATWHAFAAEQRALVRDLPILEGMLGQIATPTTVVAGSADHVVPLASARRLVEEIPGAVLRVIEGAGHLMLQRYAGEVAAVIAEAAER